MSRHWEVLGPQGSVRTAECPRACEGSGDPPFLLACPLPPFSQSSPSFPPGNRWGGQVTRANAFPEEPWRDRSRDSGEFLAGQDPRAVYFATRGRKVLFIQISLVVRSGSRAQSLALLKHPPTVGIAAQVLVNPGFRAARQGLQKSTLSLGPGS